MAASVTAALLVIGDEILSGRTKDKNIGYIAEYLTGIGIDLMEVRVVPDIEAEIVAAVNTLRERYTYLFTTGGIGPTHDDITADSIGRAFGVAVDHDPRAVAMLKERYGEGELTDARLRMARVPKGSDLIENPISKAPGFRIGNVITMAGVPSIMQAMLDLVAPTLQTGVRMTVENVDAGSLGEGIYGDGLAAIAAAHPGVSIGSYPSFTATGFRNQIVVRSKDPAAASAAARDVEALVARLTADRVPL
ncbi:competence/damage-inducible protein A [Microvirga pudoricolor]|uniref:competence/damage-inducible protein A n=1 Tax=Microvirga pudoricolor TaxID=2778729 RepID=UPI00194F3913|nr:molybdopterin-binding protein [Microvirga pudoricolor]MBM6595981.1 competence/damage-inducible protein A [Microvirga pudoricolor]